MKCQGQVNENIKSYELRKDYYISPYQETGKVKTEK